MENIEKTCKGCNNKFDTIVKIDGIIVRLYESREFCLKCQPQCNNKSKYNNIGRKLICIDCKTQYIYGRIGGGNCNTLQRCDKCARKYRRHQRKLKAREYLGNKCYTCGYCAQPKILTFHHVDPSKKEFIIGGTHTRAWHKVKAELDKCVLLCPNCHALIHTDCLVLI